MSYVIYALPRSRTFWLSRFLTYADWHCGHEEIRHLRSMDDVQSWLSLPNTGSVETTAAPFWRLIKNLKTVIIRRPVDDVMQSLTAQMAFDRDKLYRQIKRLDAKLDQIEYRLGDVMSVQYEELSQESVCQEIFEYCLPYKHDSAWWQATSQCNLQINFRREMQYYDAYAPQLNKLAKIAKHRMIADMSRVLPYDEEDEGLIIQEEKMTCFDECIKLAADHMILVGEAPNTKKNRPLMQKLEDIGCLQIMTARCNGKVFGYLMTVIAPSLESTETVTSVQTTFFASPLFKGLGGKLQRASIEALRAKGVNEVQFHAGVRGSGPRMGTLYRRLGAEDYGQVFKLGLTC